MEKLLQSLTEAERNAIQHVLDVDGDINSLTHKLMEHAYEAMQDTNNLQNADKVAEHLEDYYTTFVK
jgi:hypothetical protein|tara:strand:+ start:618 stop:818 length:201 start_codon:yes stop_codon:yes gene_type:complete